MSPLKQTALDLGAELGTRHTELIAKRPDPELGANGFTHDSSLPLPAAPATAGQSPSSPRRRAATPLGARHSALGALGGTNSLQGLGAGLGAAKRPPPLPLPVDSVQHAGAAVCPPLAPANGPLLPPPSHSGLFPLPYQAISPPSACGACGAPARKSQSSPPIGSHAAASNIWHQRSPFEH